MNISKRNRIHSDLARTYAETTKYIGHRGETPAEQSRATCAAHVEATYQRALALGIPALRRLLDEARAEIRRTIETTRQRYIGDNHEVRCGDFMHDGTCHDRCGVSRRLCGECCQPDARDQDGCGSLLETWPAPGWEDRAVERAEADGVLPPTT
jgi:hypothetical protein